MRMFFNMELYSGKIVSISEDEYNEMILDYEEVGGNRSVSEDGRVISYKFEEDVVFEINT